MSYTIVITLQNITHTAVTFSVHFRVPDMFRICNHAHDQRNPQHKKAVFLVVGVKVRLHQNRPRRHRGRVVVQLHFFFNLSPRCGGWSTPRPGRFTTGKDLVPIVQEAGWAPGTVWTGAENLTHPPTVIRSPERPARIKSLYRLSYPDPPVVGIIILFFILKGLFRRRLFGSLKSK